MNRHLISHEEPSWNQQRPMNRNNASADVEVVIYLFDQDLTYGGQVTFTILKDQIMRLKNNKTGWFELNRFIWVDDNAPRVVRFNYNTDGTYGIYGSGGWYLDIYIYEVY